nr:MAG TPA: hypothetical protein [Caudoviricetes sp.]
MISNISGGPSFVHSNAYRSKPGIIYGSFKLCTFFVYICRYSPCRL